MNSEDPDRVRLRAAVSRDGAWYVARALDIELASQGRTSDEALANLREAAELYYEEEPATVDAGSNVVSMKGSHCKLRFGSARVIVPLHSELAPGTFASILRQANITPDEFKSAF